MARVLLTESEIQEALAGLSGWEKVGKAIEKTFSTGNFTNGAEFVQAIVPLANGMNHHPDVFLTFRKVKISLITHDSGGLTALDVELAGKIDLIRL